MGLLRLHIEAGSNKVYNFQGILDVLFDTSCGYIIDWKIKLLSGSIDCMTTPAWSNPNNNQFKDWKEREKILNLIGLEQLPREPNVYGHKIVKLSEKQISILNSYFENEYNSTVYNICKFFKGSNPSGSYLNPKASEMWEVDSGHEYKINIFFNHFKNNEDPRSIKGSDENINEWSEALLHNPVNIDEYLNNFENVPSCEKNRNLKDIFNQLQISKDKVGSAKYEFLKNDIKITATKIMKNAIAVNKDTIKERAHYKSNIYKKYVNMNMEQIAKKFWVENFNVVPPSFDAAHILPVSFIKRKMFKTYGKLEEYSKIKSMISDPNNFLPLDKITHYDYYDKIPSEVYWDENGKLIKINSELKGHFLPFYSQIESSELTEQRIKYLKDYKKYCIQQSNTI